MITTLTVKSSNFLLQISYVNLNSRNAVPCKLKYKD